MFEMSTFNVDKFAHKFAQGIGLRIEPYACKKFSNIMFLTNLKEFSKMREIFLYPANKIKEINIEQTLDFSQEVRMKYVIEKYTGICDKLTYLNNTRISTAHLKTINTKILQKVKIRKKNYDTLRKIKAKAHDKNVIFNKKIQRNFVNKVCGQERCSFSTARHKENCIDFHNCSWNIHKNALTLENSKLPYRNTTIPKYQTSNDIVENNNKHEIFEEHNLATHTINIARQEVERTEKFLRLYINDVEYLRKNIRITLHITKKSKSAYNIRDRVKYNQELCLHAILCSIEPSEQGFVVLEDNLPPVIQKYLSHGYKYHFDFQRHLGDYYVALLILSQWAKVLVKHINTTMMHTICGILGCDVQQILVLHAPDGKSLNII